MAQTTHAIIGTGETSKKALYESLGEVLDEGDAVSIIWAGPPNETIEALYDYVLDNEVQFTMFYEDGSNPPKAFRTSDNGVTQKSRNPVVAAAKTVAAGGKVLILWDDDEQDDYVNAADAIDGPVLFLELSNGLDPLTFADADDDEAMEEELEEASAEEDEAFTRDELLNMPAAAVKRYGAKAGVKAATKQGIIDELFPEEEKPEEEHEVLDVGVEEVEATPDSPHEQVQDVMAGLLSMVRDRLPEGRERSLVITKLEEAAMWAERIGS